MFDIRTKNLLEACHPYPTEGSAMDKGVHRYRNGIKFPDVDRFLDKLRNDKWGGFCLWELPSEY